ncbi:hypothetical protein ABQF31_01015 [Mycobacterium syngnathidarum]
MFGAAVRAAAEPASDAVQVVSSARGNCPGLRADPAVQEVADVMNRANLAFYQQKSDVGPITDPNPLLKDRHVAVKTAVGHVGFSDAGPRESLNAAVLAGWKNIPTCKYSLVGVSVLQDPDYGSGISQIVLVEQ